MLPSGRYGRDRRSCTCGPGLSRLDGERIGDEALGRQLRPVQIAARHPRAANVNLARHAYRYRLAMPVQQIDARVGDRPADGALPPTMSVRRCTGGEVVGPSVGP